MLNWVRKFFSNPVAAVSAAVRALISTAVGAVAGVMDTVFGHVFSAWTDLWHAVDAGYHAVDAFVSHTVGLLEQIITYYIPVYAYRAWWWVTHPDQLAAVLFWYLVRELETNAWDAGRYLGEFILSLIWHNARRVLATLEAIVAAVL